MTRLLTTSPRPLSTLVRAFAWVWLLPLLAAAAPAASAAPAPASAAAERRSFDLPAGPATLALKLFSEQSGRTLLADGDLIAGVTTVAVKGDFTPREALDRLLAGTGLVAAVDGPTGAFALKRENPAPNASRATPAPAVAPATPAAPTTGEDDLFVLSPFTVEASSDSWVATSTLSGTRIRTDVRDVGASMSILTSQLMGDLGATDASSLLTIVPNVEVAGELGNYSSATSNTDSGTFDARGSRNNSTSSTRVRGLVSATNTRNYFPTAIPFDAYNTSRVTVNRGPNSVLFGLGSAGGVIENTLNRPIAKNAYEVQVGGSNYGGHREVVDINQVLIKDRLIVRAASLNEDRRYRQEEAFREDQRLYVTADWRVRKEKPHAILGETLVRGYVEAGRVDRINPDPIPPSTGWDWWYSLDRFYHLIGRYPGINSLKDIPGAYRSVADGGTWIPKATIKNTDRNTYNRTILLTPQFIGLAQVYNGPQAAGPGGVVGDLAGGIGRVSWPAPRNSQDPKMTSGDWNSLPGFTLSTLNDRQVFDYANHLYYGATDTIWDRFNVKEITLEQSFLNRSLGFEVSYNRQDTDGYRHTPYSSQRGRRLGIDISEELSVTSQLPSKPGDGAAPVLANPNLYRPMMAIAAFEQSFSEARSETTRGTLYATHDFRKDTKARWGALLGKHTVSALFQSTEDNSLGLSQRLNWQSDEMNLRAANLLGSAYNTAQLQVNSIVYVGDSVKNTTGPEQVRLNFPLARSVVPYAGQTGKFAIYDRTAQQMKVVTATSAWMNSDLGISRRELDSDAFILQSNWLQDHVVTIFATRKDKVTNYEIIPAGKLAESDGTYDLAKRRLDSTPSLEASARTNTKSLVARYPDKLLFKLPWGSDLRLSYFKSDTFQPVSIGRALDGRALSSPTGTTKEYGVILEMFDQRLALRANWFETGSLNARMGNQLSNIQSWAGAGGQWLTRMSDAERAGMRVADMPGATAAGFKSYDDIFAAIYSLTPESYRQAAGLTNTALNRTTGLVSAPGISGLTSTTDVVSKGLELEISGSITRNWNVALNLAKQEAVQTNIQPGVLEFAQYVEKRLKETGLYNLQDAPVSGGAPTTYGQRWEIQALSPLRNLRGLEGVKSAEERKWRWNVMTSYNFRAGPLSGLKVGASARWQDRVAIGYPAIYTATGEIVSDVKHPYWGPSEFNLDAFVSYRRKLFDRYQWTIQLNARNLIGGDPDQLIPVSANPIGEIQAARLPAERQLVLTNTIKF